MTRFGQKEYVARRSVEVNGRKGFCVAPLARAGGVLLVGWLVTSSLWIYPHSLSYFNEAIGGPLNGSERLLGSNVDWGQDLRYLNWWRVNNIGSSCCLDVVSFYNPALVGLPPACERESKVHGDLGSNPPGNPSRSARYTAPAAWSPERFAGTCMVSIIRLKFYGQPALRELSVDVITQRAGCYTIFALRKFDRPIFLLPVQTELPN